MLLGIFQTRTNRSFLEEDDINLGLKFFLEQSEHEERRQHEGKSAEVSDNRNKPWVLQILEC